MFGNYIKLALRNLIKNRLYASINVVGLTIGLTIYLFATLLADYEKNHDAFFEKADRIFTIGTKINPKAELGFKEADAVFTTVGPLIEADISDVEAVARTFKQQYLLTLGDRHFYQDIKFVDTAFTTIFELDYITGDATSITDPSGVFLNLTMAEKLFPGKSPKEIMGETITLDHKTDLHVVAIFNDLPANTHFNSSLAEQTKLGIISSWQVLTKVSSTTMEGQWDGLSMGNNTYILLPEHLSAKWLQDQANGLYDRHVPEPLQELMSSFTIYNVKHANIAIWDMVGMPVIASIQILGALILLVACVNYTNLATAQTLGRTREVGLRKALGALKPQLLAQFLIEGITIALLAMLLAVAALEMIVPLFNEATGKVMTLDYVSILPWLVGTTVGVGMLAGSYPAFLITRTNAIEALRDMARKGKGSSKFRAIMIGVQFGLSIFMLASVVVMYSQNMKLKESSNIFPFEEIINLRGISNDDIKPRLETLRNELTALPGVKSATFVNQAPYDQSTYMVSTTKIAGDEASKMNFNILIIDEEFLATFDIALLAGRNLNKDISNDTLKRSETGEQTSFQQNVFINQLTMTQLGYKSPEEAIGGIFYDLSEDRGSAEYTIVGVVPTINYMGLHNSLKPYILYSDPLRYNIMSVRMEDGMVADTTLKIAEVWKKVVPDYPIQSNFLVERFNDIFQIFSAMNAALAGFAAVALMLALIGLFGLAAFMAEQRTKEIGLRKVMGAKVGEIIKLLIWQFSKPVVWSMLIALPLVYFTTGLYLDFFADRISMPIGIIAITGIGALGLSWGTVAIHAARVAHTNPITALRYE